MFKKLLSTLLFLPALAIAQIETVHFESICTTSSTIEKTLKKFGEKPFITALGHRQIGDKNVFHSIVIFMNVETKTWSMFEKVDDDSYCIIAVGSKIEPYFQKN